MGCDNLAVWSLHLWPKHHCCRHANPWQDLGLYLCNLPCDGHVRGQVLDSVFLFLHLRAKDTRRHQEPFSLESGNLDIIVQCGANCVAATNVLIYLIKQCPTVIVDLHLSSNASSTVQSGSHTQHSKDTSIASLH